MRQKLHKHRTGNALFCSYYWAGKNLILFRRNNNAIIGPINWLSIRAIPYHMLTKNLPKILIHSNFIENFGLIPTQVIDGSFVIGMQ